MNLFFSYPSKVSHFTFCISYLFLGISSAWALSDWQQQPSWSSEAPLRLSTKRNANSAREKVTPVSPFSPKSNNLAIDVGQVFLMGDMGANYSDSIGTQFHYTYGVSDIFAFDTSLGYSSHSDGKFSMASGLAGLRTNIAWYDKVVPYAVLGLGFYRPSYQIMNNTDGNAIINTVSTTLFGVHVGPGVDLEVTKQLFFGASLTFHDVFSTSKPLANGIIPVGGTYTSFLLHTGITF